MSLQTDETNSGAARNWRGRAPRIGLLAFVVFAVEWRLLGAGAGVDETLQRVLPWSLAALLVPVAIGAWAFDVTSSAARPLKADLLWAVVIATATTVAAMIVAA